jgi:hypothetical protein
MTAKSQRICRFEAEQLPPGNEAAPEGAGGLLMFAMNVSPEGESDFNAWYDQEHIPALKKVPGVLSARRFKTLGTVKEAPQRYLAIYHLASPDVCSSQAWKSAVNTEWTAKLRPHFRDPLRLVLRRYERKS